MRTGEMPASATMRRAVVVDDHAGLLQAITEMLEHDGWSVRGFTSIEEALAFVRASPPDVVLTDINVGVWSGAALARELRLDRSTANIPIVAMSGTAEFTAPMSRLFDLLLRKPIELPSLDGLLRRAMADRAR